MKLKRWQSYLLVLLFAFFTTLSLRIDMSIKPFFESFYYPDMVTFFLFIIIIIFALKTQEAIKDRKILRYAMLISLLFSVLTSLGYSLLIDNSLYSMYASRGQVVKHITSFFGVAFLFYLVLVHLLNSVLNYDHSVKYKHNFFPKKNAIIYVGVLIFLLYLPYFLIYYPGIVTFDGYWQIEQSLGLKPLNNHHPLMHTLFIKMFIKVGVFISNVQFGVALHSLAQMIIVASVFSFALHKIRKWELPTIFYWSSLVYFALYPLHSVYSIFMTKDTIFSMGVLLFIIVTIDLLNNSEYFAKKINWFIFIGVALIVILIRNNGSYIIFPSLVIFLFALKKHRKQLLVITIGLLAFFIFYKTVIFSVLNVTEGPSREMLSIPLQQLARVVKMHEADLTEEQREFIENVFLVDFAETAQAYRARDADPVKIDLNEDFYNNNKVLFYTNWLKMFGSYPLTYIESFLSDSFGYWSLGAGYTNFYFLMTDHEGDTEVYADSKIPALYPIAKGFLYFRFIPVLSIFFSIGVTFFVLLLYVFICILKKMYNNILVVVPLFLLFLTCIGSPLYGEFRYAYGLFTTLPVIIAYALKMKNNDPNYLEGVAASDE